MKKTIEVGLVREARKAGGDRYESADGFVIYIPQDISRPEGKILPAITITFES